MPALKLQDLGADLKHTVQKASFGEDYWITLDGHVVAVLVGAQKYHALLDELEDRADTA